MMFERDYEMALSDEDLVTIIIATVSFVFSFADINTPESIANFSFPSIMIFLIAWILVRFRRRPLPKQVHEARFLYLGSIKTAKFYHLLSSIFLNILFLARYPPLTAVVRIAAIFNYVWIFFLLIIEFFGHIIVPDTLIVIPVIEGEDPKKLQKQRKELLYGRKFVVITIITILITILTLYVPFNATFETGDPLLILSQIISLLLAGGIVVWLYRRTMQFNKTLPPELLIKAVNYYQSMKMRDYSIKILEEYVENQPTNVGILSRLAILYAEQKDTDKVLEVTEKIIKETEEKGLKLTHTLAKAHLLRAFALAEKENYEEAYKEVTASLRYVPDNNIARKLRRDLRKRLKTKKIEETGEKD